MNIVLSHGILGFSHIGGVNYFRGIKDRFSVRGHQVIGPQVDPTRGISFRGNQLRDQIKVAFERGDLDPKQETHIIAHSMGGLDSRYILSPANSDRLESPIRSLTTIATPHRGSPVADLVDRPEHLDHFKGLVGNLVQAALAHLNISLDGLRDLTTASCQKFNQQFTDNPAVTYFSVAGSGRPNFPEASAPLLIFHKYISSVTDQKNDGMVSVDSAQWGAFDSDTWPGDHVEAVGYNLDNLAVAPGFYLTKYDRLLSKLEQM